MDVKMSIGGLKVSPELVRITLSAGESPPIVSVLDRLARGRINLVWVTLAAGPDGVAGACAIEAGSWPAAGPLLRGDRAVVDIRHSVGTLTVFPHRSRPDLLGAVLGAFEAAGLPVYGIASSISALTFTTDFLRMAQAVSAVRAIAALPDNHAPLKCPWQVRQV